MKLEFINQWRKFKPSVTSSVTSSVKPGKNYQIRIINSDFDYLWVHQEYNTGYLGFYFVIFGLGVEIVIKGD